MTLTVLEPGPLTLVQDLGRPGFAHLGVSPSGALDRGALRRANRLLGNDESAAGLEVAVGGLRLRFDAPVWFAVTGAWGEVRAGRPGSTLPVRPETATRAAAGDELLLPPAGHGLRYYLGVRGGIDAPPVLGSRASDTLSGLGPAPLTTGDRLPTGPEPAEAIPASDPLTVWAPSDGTVVIAVHPGPRIDRFAHAQALFETEWSLSARSDRVGARLEGVPLELARGDELPSEGMVAGSIQVPPSGLPTVLLADHPVTGGYPVIAVVADAALDAFAQIRPGQRVRFRHAH